MSSECPPDPRRKCLTNGRTFTNILRVSAGDSEDKFVSSSGPARPIPKVLQFNKHFLRVSAGPSEEMFDELAHFHKYPPSVRGRLGGQMRFVKRTGRADSESAPVLQTFPPSVRRTLGGNVCRMGALFRRLAAHGNFARRIVTRA